MTKSTSEKTSEKTSAKATNNYDPELIKDEIIAVCDHYFARLRRDGKRHVYECLRCGGQRFEVEPVRGIAGCFGSGCEMPTSTDAIGIIAHMEGQERRGAGFMACMEKGYEILGLDPDSSATAARHSANDKGSASNGSSGSKARSWVAGGSPQDFPGETEAEAEAPPAGAPGTKAPGTELVVERGPDGHPVEAYAQGPDGEWEVAEAFIISDGDTGPVPISEEEEAEYAAPIETAGDNPEHPEDGADPRKLIHDVYSAMLDLCKREERDYAYFEGRGVDRNTVAEGRFASLSRKRAPYVGQALAKKFSEDELLSVPGFYKAEDGTIRFSIYGNYCLYPYYDGDGYIRSVEGRLTGKALRPKDFKYKAPLDGGVHLYLHPYHKPSEIVAICEGAVGAMVAAAHGFAVASIKGVYCYRQAPTKKGEDYAILPQLAGVDFAGKTVVYIPDIDVKPESYEEVMSLVPEACRWLIEKQGGVAKVAMLPDGAKDLDDWLMSLEEGQRMRRFYQMLVDALPLQEWEEKYLGEGEDMKSGEEDEQSKCEGSDVESFGEDEQGQMIIPGGGGEDGGKATANRGGSMEAGEGSEQQKAGLELAEDAAKTNDGQGQTEGNEETSQTEQETTDSQPTTESETDVGSADVETETTTKTEDNGPKKGAMYEEMKWWFDIAALTDEEVEETRRLREEIGYQLPGRSAAPLHLRRWDAGEVIVTVLITVLVGSVMAILAHLATSESGVVALLGEIITSPGLWGEVFVFGTLSGMLALWISSVRYRRRYRYLAAHLRGEKDTGGDPRKQTKKS